MFQLDQQVPPAPLPAQLPPMPLQVLLLLQWVQGPQLLHGFPLLHTLALLML